MISDIPTKVINHVLSVARNEFADRDEVFRKQRSLIAAQASANGSLYSGNCVVRQLDLLDAETNIRAGLLLEALERAQQAFRFTVAEGSSEAARGVLMSELANTHRSLVSMMMGGAPFNSDPGLAIISRLPAMIEERLDRVRTRLLLKLDEWEAKGVNTRADRTGSTYVTVTGNANVIQAGIHSSTVSLALDASTKQTLLGTLLDMKTAVEADKTLDPKTKSYVLEIVAECQQEAAKPEPNKRKLGALLQGLETTGKTVASLEKIANGLHAGLVALGFTT